MQIRINGQNKDLPEAGNLQKVIENILPDPSRVIAELNGQIVKKPEWANTAVNDGDQVELVSFVGGG